jgi:hypothetical protein
MRAQPVLKKVSIHQTIDLGSLTAHLLYLSADIRGLDPLAAQILADAAKDLEICLTRSGVTGSMRRAESSPRQNPIDKG